MISQACSAFPIAGLQKLSLQDFPATPAAILFTNGCQLRCPYCHNPDLARGRGHLIPPSTIDAFLVARAGILPGIVISGGEPTLHPGLLSFLQRCRELGYRIKLDSNGLRPSVIRAVCEAGLVDHLALDYKLPLHRYGELGTVDGKWLSASRTAAKNMGITVEIRTTVASPLLSENDLECIADDLYDSEMWSLQRLRPGRMLNPQADLRPPSPALMDHAYHYGQSRGLKVLMR